MPANGHRAFVLQELFPETRDKRGLAEFYVASGSFSIIALRFNPTPAFTSSPVYTASGAPIIPATVTNPPVRDPRTQIITQVADGGAWSTTIVLTNTTTAHLTASLRFRTSTGSQDGATVAWNLGFLENVSTSSFTIPAASSIFLQTPGTAPDVSQGYAELIADPGVEGYAIFTSRVGQRAQDGTAPAVTPTSRVLVPFDNIGNLVTSFAIVNPGNSAGSVTVNLRAAGGDTTTGLALQLPAQGHRAAVLPSLFPQTAGKSGLAEFSLPSGTIAFIALRFSSSGAFASAPAYFENGSSIIAPSGGGGGGGGGESGNTSPTPAEIESWIARGSYTDGTLILTRSTIYATTDSIGPGGVTAVTTMTKEDSFDAQFLRISGADLAKSLRGELPPGFPNRSPAPGSCVVYQITPMDTPWPNLTLVGLDAGPQVTSNGPNGNQAAVRISEPPFGYTYHASNVPDTYLASGTYTLAGPGGADVGAFSGSLVIPPQFVVTNNPDDFKVINRSKGITVRWTGGDPASLVTIDGASLSTPPNGVAFVCMEYASAGQFTVPASVLTQLPASAVVGAGGINLVMRGSFGVTTGKSVRFTAPPGLDLLIATGQWIWSYTPQYQ
jgi:hypothetical protein